MGAKDWLKRRANSIRGVLDNIKVGKSQGLMYGRKAIGMGSGISYKFGAAFGSARGFLRDKFGGGEGSFGASWGPLSTFVYGPTWYNMSKGLIPFFIALFALDFALFKTFYWIFVVILLALVGLSLVGGFMPFDPVHIILIVTGIIIFFLMPSLVQSPDMKILIMHYLGTQPWVSEHSTLVWSLILLTVLSLIHI